MSQQLALGRNRGGGGGGAGGGAARNRNRIKGLFHSNAAKAYKSSVKEIENDTFNVGLNKYAAQFGTSRKNVANYLQKTISEEGYLVAQAVRTGKKQEVKLPPAADANDADAVRIRNVQVDAAGKRMVKLDASLKRGFAVVYDQCAPGVRDKLEASNDWEAIQGEQSLHQLIKAIERICVGFDDHKQTVYNIVQSTKKLYLHVQDEKSTVPDYARDFKALWDTCESFGGTPGHHQGLLTAALTTLAQNPNQPSDTEKKTAVGQVVDAVKGAMFLSGADQKRFGTLKRDLHNDYLMGSDNYPDSLDRAVRLLENYEGPRQPWRPAGNPGGELAFVQQGSPGRGRGRGQRRAQGGSGGGNAAAGGSGGAQAGGNSQSGGGTGGAPRVNRNGDSHCYNCGREGHYAADCPDLSEEQQQQLHMNLGEDGEIDQEDEECPEEIRGGGDEGTCLLNVCMLQRDGLPKDRAYLDNCSTVTGFTDPKYIEGIADVAGEGMKVHCNAGDVVSSKAGKWGNLKAWYLPESIANIISQNELEKHFRVTYDSWDGFYTVHILHTVR